MALAKDVGRSRGGMVMHRAEEPSGPYANMNQTQARLPPRVEARLKRVRESPAKANTKAKTAEQRRSFNGTS